MALNNRIYNYKCDVCRRSIERLADPARPDPLRCVITDQCTGKLSLTSERFGLRPINTPTVIGLLDRVKRGSLKTSPTVFTKLDRVSLITGEGGLTLSAIKSSETISERIYTVDGATGPRVIGRTPLASAVPNITLTAVLFELTPAALEYKRYTFVRTDRCIFVQGKDDSASQALLSFDNTNTLRVFVNGELLESSLYVKTFGTLTFTPELTSSALLIEIFVYKSLSQFFSESDAVRLPFITLPSTSALRKSNAWGDALSVGSYTPTFCVDVSVLDRSKTYGIARIEATDESSMVFAAADGHFLLANPPYAFEDKQLTAIVQLSSLTTEGFPLSFAVNEETGKADIVIDGSTLLPSLRPLSVVKLPIKSSQVLTTAGLLVSRNEKKFIIGPA